MSGGLGIGIITFNRRRMLQTCLEAVKELTESPHEIVIADDGSKDDTVLWARREKHCVVTGQRKGCAWNKNRALAHLLTQTDCDPILLLEEDSFPTEKGWEREWIAAARRWHHVNHKHLREEEGDLIGKGTAESPYICHAYGGQCTISTRAALQEIGYLDSRFVGYGWEHVEWTNRFRWKFRSDWMQAGIPRFAVPCLAHGVRATWTESYGNQKDMTDNAVVYRRIRSDPLYRRAWRTQEEFDILRLELAGSAYA